MVISWNGFQIATPHSCIFQATTDWSPWYFRIWLPAAKKRKVFLEHIHQTLLYIIFLIDEFTTAAILHPESSLKVYKNLASVAVCKKENKQSGNSYYWQFSVHILSPENKRTISLALQLVTFPVQTCRFTQEARQSQPNLQTSQSFSLFPWPNLSLILTDHSSFTRMLCLQFFPRWPSREQGCAVLQGPGNFINCPFVFVQGDRKSVV